MNELSTISDLKTSAKIYKHKKKLIYFPAQQLLQKTLHRHLY